MASAKSVINVGLWVVLGVIGAVFVVGIVVANDKPDAPKQQPEAAPPAHEEVHVPVDAAPTGPPIVVTARKLFADYEANEVSADDKYKGKLLAVSGTIEAIGKDVLGDPFVEFTTTGGLGVQCMFDSAGALGLLKKGERLAVICRGDGKMGNVILRGCLIDK